MAEEGWIDNQIAKLTIHEYLKDFPKIDALILGCTHYPLFKKIIKDQMPETEIIDTGEKLANSLLKNKINKSDEKEKEDEIFLTDTECNFINVSYKLLGKSIKINKAIV